MKVYVIPNYRKKETSRSMERMLRWAEETGSQILTDPKWEKRLPEEFREAVRFLDPAELAEEGDCQYIVTIGGDGTLIRGAALSAELDIPIVGVNTGTLGFLAGIEPDKISRKMTWLLEERNFHIEERTGVSASVKDTQIPFAINDIVLQKAIHGGLAMIDIFYGSEIIGHYRSDGLIVATPTGSTAYAYAAGGPAIHPAAEVLAVMPICPQNKMNIPLVAGIDKPISFCIQQGTMKVLADGVEYGTLRKGAQMTVTCAERKLKLVRFEREWGILDWQEKVSRL
ncbi:MAG: NAD(+)/NADH kinase [Mogibacterium sp.]|nr:NAD(+)/NADH kinase [Mogibacterium sp.]